MIIYPDTFEAQNAQSWDGLAALIINNENSDFYVPGNGIATYVRVKGFSDNDLSEHIVVGFSGAVKNQGLKSGPFFSFTGISSLVGLPLISFSDPSLMLDSDLTLGWHLGNKYIPDYADKIANLLDRIVTETGRKVILAGGSGGGFAALNIANKMLKKEQAIALVWNPQVILNNYYESAVSKYIASSWEAINSEVIRNVKISSIGVKAVFLMDGLDHAHLRLHLREYVKDEAFLIRNNGYFIYQNSMIMLGDWGAGHSAPPKDVIIHHFQEIIRNWDAFDTYSGLPVKKEIVDFSNAKVGKKLEQDIKPLVSIVSKNFMIEIDINKKYIGYQLKYELLDKTKNKIMFSPWLKNYHNCRVFGALPKKIDLEVLTTCSLVVTVEDYFGKEKSFSYPIKNNMKKYYYMKHC